LLEISDINILVHSGGNILKNKS